MPTFVILSGHKISYLIQAKYRGVRILHFQSLVNGIMALEVTNVA